MLRYVTDPSPRVESIFLNNLTSRSRNVIYSACFKNFWGIWNIFGNFEVLSLQTLSVQQVPQIIDFHSSKNVNIINSFGENDAKSDQCTSISQKNKVEPRVKVLTFQKVLVARTRKRIFKEITVVSYILGYLNSDAFYNEPIACGNYRRDWTWHIRHVARMTMINRKLHLQFACLIVNNKNMNFESDFSYTVDKTINSLLPS